MTFKWAQFIQRHTGLDMAELKAIFGRMPRRREVFDAIDGWTSFCPCFLVELFSFTEADVGVVVVIG